MQNCSNFPPPRTIKEKILQATYILRSECKGWGIHKTPERESKEALNRTTPRRHALKYTEFTFSPGDINARRDACELQDFSSGTSSVFPPKRCYAKEDGAICALTVPPYSPLISCISGKMP